MADSLFPEEDLPAMVGISPRERLIASYTTLLLNEPPVKSLMPENCPDETERRRRACNIASKDVPRNLRALRLSCMEVAESARMASAKHLLKSWLKASLDDAASGGNGSEDINVDSLIEQTRGFLGKEFSI